MKLTAELPLSGIEQIRLYINTGRKTPAEIKAETGADYLINGGLYDMAEFIPYCHLKADGYVYAEDPYTYWGFAWDTGPDIAMAVVPDAAKQNYICCTALIEPSGPAGNLIYTAGQGGTRGRTVIGLKGDRLCLYCSGDGTEDAATPEELRDELSSLGWGSAVMLDSGGSSQCDFAGEKIESGRIVHNLILVYLKKGDGVKKVCLDPGHGAETPGKCSPDKTYYEHEFNLDLANRMKPILERHGVEVALTRTDEHCPTGKSDTADLNYRVKLANAIDGLDLFVSIHTNAAGNDGWYGAKGLSCITSAAGDTAERNKAANAILARMKEAGIILRSTPLAHDITLIVLRKTSAPAVLIEHGFHTSREETELLKTSAYRDRLAVAECRGILDYLGIAWVEEADYAAAVRERFGLSDDEIAYLSAYTYAGDLFKALATKN